MIMQVTNVIISINQSHLKLLGVTIDEKLSFNKHILSIARAKRQLKEVLILCCGVSIVQYLFNLL